MHKVGGKFLTTKGQSEYSVAAVVWSITRPAQVVIFLESGFDIPAGLFRGGGRF